MTKERFAWIIKSIYFDRLSDWETNFLEKCERGMKRYGKLLPWMEERLEEIHREKA